MRRTRYWTRPWARRVAAADAWHTPDGYRWYVGDPWSGAEVGTNINVPADSMAEAVRDADAALAAYLDAEGSAAPMRRLVAGAKPWRALAQTDALITAMVAANATDEEAAAALAHELAVLRALHGRALETRAQPMVVHVEAPWRARLRGALDAVADMARTLEAAGGEQPARRWAHALKRVCRDVLPPSWPDPTERREALLLAGADALLALVALDEGRPGEESRL